jgi:digeranylgeranylglycerophospholipid reductase
LAGVEPDVLIVGAGTAGAYLAWKLAELGFSCTVLERESLDSLGASIGPFHMEESAFERFGIPLPEEPELLHRVTDMTTWSPRFTSSLSFQLPTLVMDKPLFTQRLHSYAREAGADIVEKAEVVDLLADGGILRGVKTITDAEEVKWRARLVIDASGIQGAVRTRMPRSIWFESEPLSDDDTIFVYMETWRGLESKLVPGVNSFPYYIGWCAPGPGDTNIVGVGMGVSHEAAKRRHREMLEHIPLKGEVVGSTRGRIPYRRPPYSLVDNCLMVVGDAACMNKPFSGEGVTSGFAGCDALLRAAVASLESDDLTRDGLWRYNVEYFRGQGAAFAFLTAVLPALMAVSEAEMETFFSLPGLLTEEGALTLQREYEVKADVSGALAALPGIVRALLERRVSGSSLATIARIGAIGAMLKAMYRRYPETPIELGGWMRRAGLLWRRAESAKRKYFERG